MGGRRTAVRQSARGADARPRRAAGDRRRDGGDLRRDPAALAEEHVEFAEEELERARGEIGTFRVALQDLAARGGTGDAAAEVPYDSTDPVQFQADALIQYVVRPGYGEVRTEQPAPNRYVYFLRADWPRLRELAAEAGHELPL